MGLSILRLLLSEGQHTEGDAWVAVIYDLACVAPEVQDDLTVGIEFSSCIPHAVEETFVMNLDPELLVLGERHVGEDLVQPPAIRDFFSEAEALAVGVRV